MQFKSVRYKSVVDRNHPLANSQGSVKVHRKLLYDRIGPGEHNCHWCGRVVRWSKQGTAGNKDPHYLAVDHVDGDSFHNVDDNLVPSCQSCNTRRAHQRIHVNPSSLLPSMKPGRSRYKQICVPEGHPLVNPGSPAKVLVHRLVLYNRIGPGPHPCHWCGKLVDWTVGRFQTKGAFEGALIVDHLDDYGKNNDPENLVPSCQDCNIHRTTKERFERIPHVIVDGRRYAAIKRTCNSCGKDFLVRPCSARRHSNSGKYCSRECAANGRYVACREVRTCETCGNEFLFVTKMSKWVSGRYCSKRCNLVATHLARLKLTEAQRMDVREKRIAGKTIPELAKEFSVCHGTIENIIYDKLTVVPRLGSLAVAP